MKKQIQINPADNVVVAVDTLSAGDHITVGKQNETFCKTSKRKS